MNRIEVIEIAESGDEPNVDVAEGSSHLNTFEDTSKKYQL
jgi:hypothetical protein